MARHKALWRRYIPDPELAVDRIAEASDGFTPADIRHSAQRVAQHSFETAVTSGHRHHATVTDYLTAIADTTPTLTPDMITAFAEDTTAFARI